MTNGDIELGKTIGKTSSLEDRVERIENKLDKVYDIVCTWRGMAIAYGVVISLVVSALITIGINIFIH